MDEPLSNLDAKLRAQMRTELIDLHKRLSTTFVYVTHDQTEAMSMATNIILLNKGDVQQVDTPFGIYNNPNNAFTAQFIGSPVMNILDADRVSPYLGNLPEKTRQIGFRPSKVELWNDSMGQEDRLTFEGAIVTREMMGSEIIYRMNCPIGTITFKTFDETQLEPESNIRLSVSRDHLYFFDADGLRIKGAEQ